MNLSDIPLTDEQVSALLDMLDQHALVMKRRELARERDREHARHLAVTEDRVYMIGQLTARCHGRLGGMRHDDQAQAAWASFVWEDGLFDPSDIDDNFDPGSGSPGDPWFDSFARGYTNVLLAYFHEQVGIPDDGEFPRLSPDEARDAYQLHLGRTTHTAQTETLRGVIGTPTNRHR